MAKISTYPIISTPTLNDLLIGTDVENLNITKNFSIGDIASFIVGGSYVPYVGATGNVNLGAFNITASSFIVAGGLATQFVKANGTLDSTVYQPAGNYITQLSGEATALGPGNAAVTLSNSAVINKVLTGLTITGNAIVATDSILTAFGKVQNQINTLVGGVQYKGTWNAATNVPALVSSVGVSGNYYVVSVAGNTNLNGITDWNLGDWAIFNGSAWEKVDNTDAVISVNGQVGAVVLTTTNINEGTNLYFTNSRARTSINLTTTGNSGAATYNNTNGFFNIPEYTLSGLGGVPLTRQLTINGTAFDLSANRSWSVGTVTSIAITGPLTGGTITGSGTIGITQAGASSDGYLSSTDWNTFNNKQNALTNPVTGTGTIFTLPMWGGATSLIDSPLSYGSNNFNFQYNSATGGTVTFTNSGLTAYAYTIQMNNFGSPRSTVHSYTDGIVVQSIAGTQVSRLFANGNLILGTGTADNGHKLEVTGSLYVNTIANATVDTDRFIVSDGGVIKYRTGTELRSDIGAGIGSVTSVGLSMPSAFSVANSPITGAGTIAVTGAGSASQYVRGDGTLADFPTTTGGGSSVSYYLNGSVSQGTIGGVAYKELSKTPVFGAGTNISISVNGYIASFITDAGDPNSLEIPAGNWNFETYFSASSNGGTPSFYVELYRYDGTTFTLIASSVSVPEFIAFGTTLNPYFSTLAVPQTSLALTDRLAIRYHVNTSGRTITLHTENNNLCQIVTTFSRGLTALNGLTAQVQYFQVGNSGTDFNISSASTTHTFNLPDASASNRGVITTGTQTFAGYKIFNGTIGANVDIQLATQGTALNTFIKNINATGQTSIGSNGFGFNNANNIYFSGSSKGGGIIAFSNTGNQTYTLQNASGTLAFTSDLGAYLPLSGGTLTGGLNGTSANFTGNIGSDTSVFAGQAFRSLHSGSVSTINGYNSIQGDANGFIVANTTKGLRINFPSNSSFTHTLPDASGTIALTSNLSAYLPLSGGTLTGALNGTSAQFSGDLQSGTRLIAAASSQSIILTPNSGGTTNRIESVGTLPLALVSAAAITMAAGGTTPQITLATGGGVTLTGALNGTTTSFSSSANIIGIINTTNANGATTNYQQSGSNVGWIGNGSNALIGGSTNDFTINGVNSLNLAVGGFGRLTISSTGAATFSSSVTSSNSFISNVVNGYGLRLNRAAVTNFNGISHATGGVERWFVGMRENLSSNNYIIYNEATGVDTLTLNSSTGAATFSGTARVEGQFLQVVNASAPSVYINNTAVQWRSYLPSNNYAFSDAVRDVLTLGYNGSPSFFQGCNVGIGTASPAGRLHIANTSGSGQPVLELQQQNSGSNILQWRGSSGTYLGVISDTGNVGIGTASPSRRLDVVNDTATSQARFAASNENSASIVIENQQSAHNLALYSTGSTAFGVSGWGNSGIIESITNVVYSAFNGRHLFQSGTSRADRMVITSTGLVGIGTASPANPLVVQGSNTLPQFRIVRSESTNQGFTIQAGGGQAVFNSIEGSNIVYGDYLFNSTKGTDTLTRMVISNAGRVGIGTTNPNVGLHVSGVNEASAFDITNTTASTGKTFRIASQSTGNLVFEDISAATERMRITSGGALLINGQTQGDGALQVFFNDAASSPFNYGARIVAGRTNSSVSIGFGNPNGIVGSIQTSGSTTSYNTSSDYRLKENVKPLENALSKLNELKPCLFNFIADADEELMGFIAHEVQEVIPQAVTGEKDGFRIEEVEVSPAELDEEGNVITEAVIEEKEMPLYQGIDHSKLVPLLVAAIQELKTEIDSLKNQIK